MDELEQARQEIDAVDAQLDNPYGPCYGRPRSFSQLRRKER